VEAKMAKCTFCGTAIEQGTGKIFVMKDGKVLNFCSTKCEKNRFKLKRIPRKMTWVVRKKK
jgi:large subunit ribosomal protein L24e